MNLQKTRGDERHGLRHTPEYKTWDGIRQRTSNPKCSTYNRYGGKGITMCKRWKDSFIAFYEDMGDRPSSNHSIDRIDGSKGYSPENCRWATREQQNRNRTFPNHPTGVNGVCIDKKSGKYKVSIRHNGKQLHLGFFIEFDGAVAARKQAEVKYAFV